MRTERIMWDGECSAGHRDRLWLRVGEAPNQDRVICDKVVRDPPVVGRAVGVCGARQTWKAAKQ